MLMLHFPSVVTMLVAWVLLIAGAAQALPDIHAPSYYTADLPADLRARSFDSHYAFWHIRKLAHIASPTSHHRQLRLGALQSVSIAEWLECR